MDIENAENTENQPSNEAIVKTIQEGHTDQLPQLYSQTKRFIYGYALKYWRHLPEAEQSIFEVSDFRQCGWPALCAAAETYSPDSDANFLTWLSFYLHRECAILLGHRYNHTDDADRKKHAAFVNADSLDRPIPGTDDLTIGDTLEDLSARGPFDSVEDKIYNTELRQELDRNIAQLPGQQQRVINQHYFESQEFVSIAESEGCSFQWVSQQHRHALRRLKQNALRQTGEFKSKLELYIDDRTDFYGRPENQVIRRENIRNAVAYNPCLVL